MNPQVARNYPSQQLGATPGYGNPSFESSAQSGRADRPAPLPYRNSRNLSSSSTLSPLHRAYPVDSNEYQRPLALGRSLSDQDFGGEHMLRRKTPNGTLAAGYDGTPVQWSSKAPALKHVVLEAPGVSTFSDGLNGMAGSGWTFNSPNNFNNLDQRVNNSSSQNWTAFSPLQNNFYNFAGPVSPMHQIHSYFSPTGFSVPTARQPAYQPGPGPTASNDGGLYGPYWPDGSYTPYRPAAYRDHTYGGHGFQHVRHGSEYFGGAQPLLQAEFNNVNPPAHRDTPFMRVDDHSQSYDSMQQNLYQIGGSSNVIFSDPPGAPVQALSRAGNAQFKEKTLSWAHTIYVDLLAHLHQTKKENRQNRQSHGSKSYAKSVIYPKPPRQPSSSFSSPGNSQNATPRSHRPSLSHRTSYGFTDSPEGRYSRSMNQVMGAPHYVPPFQSSQHSAASPLSNAQEALDLLTSLCEESHWIWVDGMLLGGCLAYGLEDYNRARDWYEKIIVIDPRHVEAISNLAATLLCLQRRDEAEANWRKSVNLRPNYFEAVEHLIGLLCGDHRGKEAVAIIEFVERSLRISKSDDHYDHYSETSSSTDREYHDFASSASDTIADYDDRDTTSTFSDRLEDGSDKVGFGSSGFAIPGSENGRILALIHAKGNMLYALGDVSAASKAFEDAVVISTGKGVGGIQGLIRRITHSLSVNCFFGMRNGLPSLHVSTSNQPPLLLPPDKALETKSLVFAGRDGELPGLRYIPPGLAQKAAVSTTSNSLLSLAKIFQDAMSNSTSNRISRMPTGVGDILALYYLSLSLQPSPSTANNVGILLASVQQPAAHRPIPSRDPTSLTAIPGVIPGSGIALALAYYNYGLLLDSRHAHLYTNLGSLLKDIGQLPAAIKMYEKAVHCDGTFDIALANLANAVKDQGRTSDAIEYYKRAVKASPDFAEAVCGLSNALNSVCDWKGRGGVILDGGKRDRWHVDDDGMISEANPNKHGGGLMKRVVDIVAKQLREGSTWGRGTLQGQAFFQFLRHLEAADCGGEGKWPKEKRESIQTALGAWAGHRWEGARIVRLVERATKRATYRWYQDRHVKKKEYSAVFYPRPQFPSSLSIPSAPTVLPFHTFTCPLSAKDIRLISQRNALRISCSTLRSPWMQGSVFPPPSPPKPHLNIGYVSSDFNNHPLAHLMQSVFGFHNPSRAKAFCYATTASDNSIHRQQIEREAPVFRDVSSWSADRLVNQIVQDGIHILVNLNGYTRGARNEVFAARPAPIQMSFMGFAGTLGAEWCDYLLADETAIPPETLRPWRRNLDLEDQIEDEQSINEDRWVYSENIIFCRDTFFCCDHAQSEPRDQQASWKEEQTTRWKMRKQLFPSLSDDAIILGNFNQLYKIEPTTFRTWLRILDKVPKAILWLLRFPDLGESNLKATARDWAGESVASRIWFTDVAPKHQHISRARVCDLFLDTPECNAHTTAADVLWSSTPLLTLPRYKYKMCSRMAASILKGALPRSEEGKRAASELIAKDEEQYEEFAIRLAKNFHYDTSMGYGIGRGRLGDLRRLLYENRYDCALFDTRRWVRDLEEAYEVAWGRWVDGEGGDIYIR
ncbi:a69aa3e8-c77a-470f-9550-d0152119600b [Sclerotinia trifoliorum]|uniref:protein O-GlcNAc transferase n=1 Tax=Sclerotinia trifoliorum TaxID=28548 RepID=A0A8H2ZT40_9HELO|nr:a69aa3e8-c77a-470f-9550-d0152119600b [Sclerotinia trifoliorum]